MNAVDDLPTNQAIVHFERIDIPAATEPKVVFQPELAHHEDLLDIDNDQLKLFLRQTMGWTAVEAAVYLEFSGPKEFSERYNVPEICTGAYKSIGFREQLDPDDPTALLSYRHAIAIPLSSESINPTGVTRLNKTLRHELGHAVCKHRFGKERLYHYLFRKEDDGSYQGKALGIIPVRTVVRIAELLDIDGLTALHRLDREERFANKFAREHAKVLNPISLLKN